MIATVKYLSDDEQKALIVENFKNVYFYSTFVEIRSGNGICENTTKVPNDNFISINIEQKSGGNSHELQ